MYSFSRIQNNVTATLHHLHKTYPVSFFLSSSLLLSWLFAITEQIAIPLPFNPVPIIIQQIVLFALSLILGWVASSGYLMFLIQGALGAPFFAHGLGGIARLLGPTGGYLMGMAGATLFLSTTRTIKQHSWFALIGKIEIANIIMFGAGLMQLSFFVPTEKLLTVGLLPFLVGDFGIKAAITFVLVRGYLK